MAEPYFWDKLPRAPVEPPQPPGGGIPNWLRSVGTKAMEVGKRSLPGLPAARTMLPWLGKAALSPYGAAVAASPFIYGAFRKQIDPLWGLNDPWGLGTPAESGIPETTTFAQRVSRKARIKPEMSPQEQLLTAQDYLEAKRVADLATGQQPKPAVRWQTTTDPTSGLTIIVGYDETGNIVSYEPTNYGNKPLTAYPTPTGAVPKDLYGRTATWNARTNEWNYPPGWEVDPLTQAAGYRKPLSLSEEAQLARMRDTEAREARQGEKRIDLEERRIKAEADERRSLMTANLATQPRSWLEYASYTGQVPTIQPWMLPLMPQQYGLRVGAPIPGYSPQGMASMPELTPPSTQLWARMGPTAQQQMLGYGTARTGLTPEEQQWRMWSQAPPSGRFGGLQWNR